MSINHTASTKPEFFGSGTDNIASSFSFEETPDKSGLEEKKLDDLNLSVYSKLPVEKYLLDYQDREFKTVKCIPILTGVGCPYSCSYCPYPLGYGSKTLNKSVEKCRF